MEIYTREGLNLLKNASFKIKLLSLVSIFVFIAFTFTISFVSITANNMAKNEAFSKAEEISYRYGNSVKAEIEVAMDSARTIAQTFESMKSSNTSNRNIMDNILKKVLEENPSFLGTWSCWEPNTLDGKDSEFINKTGSDSTGRYISYFNRGSGAIKLEPLVDYEKPGAGDYYLLAKKSGQETILNPFKYSISGKDVLMTSLVVPIKYNGTVIGVVGIDFSLSVFQTMVNDIKPYGNGFASIISNDCKYVAYIDQSKIDNEIENSTKNLDLKNSIKSGLKYTTTEPSSVLNSDAYKVFVPINIGKSTTPWCFAVTIPIGKILEKANNIRNYSIIIGIISMLLLMIIIYVIAIKLVRPIKELTKVADKLALGDIEVNISASTKDEIGDLMNSFGKMVANIRAQAYAAERIAAGDLTTQLEVKSDNDILSKKLNMMIGNLKALVTDANNLEIAALEGKFNTRADASKHQGDYRNIISGVNKTLDALIDPVKEASSVLQEMAKNNLQISVKGHYKGNLAEIANALNNTINSFNEVLGDINTASEQVAAGSKQVADSSISLSQGATEQASSVEELTVTLEEISIQTKLNAQNASQANNLAESVKTNALQGNIQMKEMLEAMKEINDASSNISKIIKAIDEIAFQTNILALNAAVEAARAGQHGKGFAVVAEEVRNLAARSANAAKETTDMIEGSMKKVEGGTKIANNTAAALNEIVEGVEKVNSLISNISLASNEQASSIAQVSQGITQVSNVVQNNSAAAEEIASSSEELSSQAEFLRDSVNKFKLKKINASYSKLDDISPEILRMLEDISRNKQSQDEAAASNLTISLSDTEFDKY